MSHRIAGQRATCGRKASTALRVNDGSGMRNRAEVEAFKRGFRDFEARHGREVKSLRQHVSSGTEGRRSTRLAPRVWHLRFLRALARTGEIRSAAVMIGMRPATAQRAIVHDHALNARAWQALGEHALRMLRQVAKGQLDRWELSQRTARALLGTLEGAGSA